MSLLRDFLRWWAAEMAALVPARLRGRDRDGADALLVDAGGAGAEVGIALRRRGREAPLGRVGPGDAAGLRALLGGQRSPDVLVRVPPDRLLEHVVSLPLAAERDLDRALGYEFDRFTPFAAADVHWSWTLLHQDRARRELRVRLSLVPRAALAPLLDMLRAAGQPPTGLRVAGPDGGQRHISLLDNPPAGSGGGRAVLAAGALCAALALVAAALPILVPLQTLAGIERDIERLRPRLAEVEALRREIAARTGGEDVVAAETALRGSALAAIALLTDLLPDDTHLRTLTLRQRQVTLTGQSADAARLIPRLAADPALRDVSFLSPVTRAEPSGGAPGRAELFSLRLDLGG